VDHCNDGVIWLKCVRDINKELSKRHQPLEKVLEERNLRGNLFIRSWTVPPCGGGGRGRSKRILYFESLIFTRVISWLQAARLAPDVVLLMLPRWLFTSCSDAHIRINYNIFLQYYSKIVICHVQITIWSRYYYGMENYEKKLLSCKT